MIRPVSSTLPVQCPYLHGKTCERGIWKRMNWVCPKLSQVVNGPRQGDETINFRLRKSKVKVTRRRCWIWRPGGGIVLDPFRRVDFLVFMRINWGYVIYWIMRVELFGSTFAPCNSLGALAVCAKILERSFRSSSLYVIVQLKWKGVWWTVAFWTNISPYLGNDTRYGYSYNGKRTACSESFLYLCGNRRHAAMHLYPSLQRVACAADVAP